MLTTQIITDTLLKRIAEDDVTAVDELVTSRKLFSGFKIEHQDFTPLTLILHFDASNALDHLLKKNPNGTYQFPEVAKDLNSGSMMVKAAQCGSIKVLERMLHKNEDGSYEFPALVTDLGSPNNFALYEAVRKGHANVVNRLLKKNTTHTLSSRLLSHLPWIGYKWKYEFPAVIKNIEQNIAHALLDVARLGHLGVLERLLQKNEDGSHEFPAALQSITSNNNAALYHAACNGHLGVVNFLLQKKRKPTIISRLLSHLPWIGYKWKYEFPAVAHSFIATQSDVLEKTAKQEHLELTWRLLQQNENGTPEFPGIMDMIASNSNAVLIAAARKGDLLMVNHLLQKNEDGSYKFPTVVKHITASRNHVLCGAVAQGQLDVVNRLLHKNKDGTYEFPDVVKQIKIVTEMGFQSIADIEHVDLVNRLLTFKDVFSYAEMHVEEYGELFVNPLVNSYLQTLAKNRDEFETEQPNGVFDLSDDEADYAYYVLRNLIRRGEPLDSINALLNIPAVNNLAARDDNELLKLAIRNEQRDAAARLLAHPAVLAHAQQNNFYAQEMQSGVDLRQLAQNTESSMVALSGPEKERVENLKKRYQSVADEMGGTAQVIVHYKTYLQQSYQAAPAQVSLNNLKIVLPFEWGDLQSLKARSRWTHAEYTQVLQAYYKHDAHTAYRYLSKPNHWMAPNVSFVYVDEEDTSNRYASFESYLPMIALYWVAAKDENEPKQEGVTHVERMQLFTKQLAYVNRQHNWDKKDKDGKEYNDLEGDKPSCYSGVTRNLFISLHKHSVMQTQSFVTVPELTEAVRGCIVGFYKSHFQNLDTGTIEGLEKAVMSYFIDAERLPNIPNIPQDEIDALKLELNIKYAGKQVQGFQSISDYVDKTFDASNVGDSHFMKFYQTFSLDVMLQTRSWQRP